MGPHKMGWFVSIFWPLAHAIMLLFMTSASQSYVMLCSCIVSTTFCMLACVFASAMPVVSSAKD